MIKNLWKNTTFYCGHGHEMPIEMYYKDGPLSMFYACPKYYPENRTKNERACSNRLNFVDAEAIIEKFSAIIEEKEADNTFFDFTNFSFKYRSIEVKVLEYSLDSVKLQIINRKALK